MVVALVLAVIRRAEADDTAELYQLARTILSLSYNEAVCSDITLAHDRKPVYCYGDIV